MTNPKNHFSKLFFLASLLLALVMFFCYEKTFAKQFFLTCLCFGFYYQLLAFGLKVQLWTDKGEGSGKYGFILYIFSGLRLLIIAGFLAVFILKFKFNLIAMALAFILFQVILIASGFLTNAHHNTNPRTNS